MNSFTSKTGKEYWNHAWSRDIHMRLPSSLNVSVGNLKKLLKTRVKPGMRVLEIGCAPGKTLAWVKKELNSFVAGLDYSERGISLTRRLFVELGIAGDIRYENIFYTSFPPGEFDVVYSTGLIEHFDDPIPIVRQHVILLKPKGVALIAVPNYGGIYGSLQRYFDNENLSLHNLDIMSCQPLTELSPQDLAYAVRAYPFGRISPWIIGFEKKLSRINKVISYVLNAVGLLQPFDITPLCPMLVLEIIRKQ